MPVLSRPDAEIYYEEYGAGFPVLVFAPGGVRSEILRWRQQRDGGPVEWFDPMRDLAGDFRVIAMDQRNAGRSRARVSADDGWHSYTGDHLALLDHLGIESCHLLGGCIGVSFAFALCAKARHRVSAAVLMNPIGADGQAARNLRNQFAMWGKTLRQERPEIEEAALAAYCDHLYGPDFVFSVTRDFVRSCDVPCLLLPGDEGPHPKVISDEIAALAPRIEIMDDWKGIDRHGDQKERILAFLQAHTSAL